MSFLLFHLETGLVGTCRKILGFFHICQLHWKKKMVQEGEKKRQSGKRKSQARICQMKL